MSGTKKSTTGKVGKVEGNSSTAKAEAEQKALDNADAELKAEAEAETNVQLKTTEPEASTAESSSQSEPDSKKLEKVENDKPEQDASMVGTETKEGKASEQVDSKKDDVVHPGDGVDAIGILGAFKVCAKSDAGFWRSGVQFHRLQEKLVLVVEQEPDASARVHAKDHEPECVVFLSPEKAKRVHDEPHLTVEVVELEDVLDLQDMQQ
ncbi:hypothetical protein OPW13_20045 [Vibrio europaeus]|uniref:hypothetical protein n=1 Tax=Vibrio europaeus TaxID=300876 RepID=UPI000A073E39|nr:hypothetical protein [Vibrio europaeus]MDC5843754.1 hypothetical protein [Vibrio europaeus]MDC5860866.1 hypothetical protein [Vibrio europaeus]MDC5866299.1 hypothetical protein [Vibrio europaeus]